jgi:nanoRNase/pAp phosphatase (c-di-AMP/oligoRNAs hydrolase)
VKRIGGVRPANHIIDPAAMSAARVVFQYYGGHPNFPRIGDDIMRAVDKADSARFTKEEILRPEGWTLLNFLMDSRTGLGRFREFRISNYELMMKLIDYCRNHTIEEILSLPDVNERVELFRQHEPLFREQLLRCARVHRDIVVLDLRDEETIYAGNRFMIYALFPDCRVSMHVLWGVRRQNTVFAIGKSIIDRSSPVDIGALCLSYGGGGHAAAGTCQVDNSLASATLSELVRHLATHAH